MAKAGILKSLAKLASFLMGKAPSDNEKAEWLRKWMKVGLAMAAT